MAATPVDTHHPDDHLFSPISLFAVKIPDAQLGFQPKPNESFVALENFKYIVKVKRGEEVRVFWRAFVKDTENWPRIRPVYQQASSHTWHVNSGEEGMNMISGLVWYEVRKRPVFDIEAHKKQWEHDMKEYRKKRDGDGDCT